MSTKASALRDTLVIARRELLERVRTRWFVAMTLLGPVFMVALIVVPVVIASRGAKGARVEIVDKSGALAEQLEAKLRDVGWAPKVVAADTPDATEMARIRDNAINGYVLIPADALDGGTIVYRGDNASNQMVQAVLGGAVTDVVRRQRGVREQIPPDKLDRLLARPSFDPQQTTGDTQGTSGRGAFAIAYILAIILYMVITIYGVAVMRAVVQEKTSRVIELMVAAVKPRSLLGGKVLGVGAAGLIQVTIWLVMGALALYYQAELLAMFGVKGGGPQLPPFELLEITVVLAYFVLGFFFYSTMYAAAGALVSSEQDTQQVQMPVTMLLIIGFLCFQVVSNDPRGGAASAMTQIPFWSPMLMPMRFVLGGASLAEVGLSLVILIVSTGLVVRAAAKIYRIGVLMYGKRPSVAEVVRWLRH